LYTPRKSRKFRHAREESVAYAVKLANCSLSAWSYSRRNRATLSVDATSQWDTDAEAAPP